MPLQKDYIMHLSLTTDFSLFDKVRGPAGFVYDSWRDLSRVSSVRSPSSATRYTVEIINGSSGSAFEYKKAAVLEAILYSSTPAANSWTKHVLNPSASTDIDSLSETINAMFDCLNQCDPSVLYFGGFAARDVNGEHLAAALRASSSWRDEISGWDNALEVAAEALRLAGIAPEDALFGMV